MKITIEDPNPPICIPYPRVNCFKTLPLTAAHTQIDQMCQYPQGFHLYSDYLLLFQLFQVVLMRQQSCSTNL